MASCPILYKTVERTKGFAQGNLPQPPMSDQTRILLFTIVALTLSLAFAVLPKTDYASNNMRFLRAIAVDETIGKLNSPSYMNVIMLKEPLSKIWPNLADAGPCQMLWAERVLLKELDSGLSLVQHDCERTDLQNGWYGLVAWANGDLDIAAHYWQEVPVKYVVDLANYLIKNGQEKRGEELFDVLLDAEMTNRMNSSERFALYSSLVQYYENNQDWSNVVKYAEAGNTIQPGDPKLVCVLARSYREAGEYDRALSILQEFDWVRAQYIHPNFRFLYYVELGRSSMAIGDLATAALAFEQASGILRDEGYAFGETHLRNQKVTLEELESQLRRLR